MKIKQPPEHVSEEWVVQNLPLVTGNDEVRLLGRQVRLWTGRIADVVAIAPVAKPVPPSNTRYVPWYDWYVIEVKKHVIDRNAVIQLLDYMGTLDFADDSVMHMLCKEYKHPSCGYAKIHGILVAPEIKPDAARVAWGAGCCYFRLDLGRGVADDHESYVEFFQFIQRGCRGLRNAETATLYKRVREEIAGSLIRHAKHELNT